MLEAKRYGRQDDMRSWTHRPLRNVNASTRGFDICPGAGNAKNGERVSKTLARRDPFCANMREWPMECKDAFHGPFAFLCEDA